MAWIELHQTLPRHPKLLRLAGRLRVHPAQAAGHLTFLWLWTLDYAPTGDLSAFGPAEISAAACFPGDAEQFQRTLIETGWLDEDGHVHDWHEYAGRLVEERAQAKARMRAFRERQKADKEQIGTRAQNVTGTCAERSELPNPTQPNRTQPNHNTGAKAPRFAPPTREELDLEAAKIGLPPEQVDQFAAYYGANGWRVGRNPMKSWPHALANWAARWRERTNEQRERNRGSGHGGSAADQRRSLVSGAEAVQRQAEESARKDRELVESGRLPI